MDSGVEKFEGFGQQQRGRFFGNVVAARQADTRHFPGTLPPKMQHVKTLADRAMRAPQHPQRLLQLPACIDISLMEGAVRSVHQLARILAQ